MELHEYPRPANDTGIGIHWVVGYATGVGLSRIREFWLPELKAMGVKWVKIFNHDGALDFCELLLAEGIMPVVRIYRPSPNPGRLGVKELVHIDALVRAGVRYFEFNNEPDVDAEWKGGRVPVNGLDLTVDNTIANLEIVLERGGMPAIPAVANGSRWDLVGRIVAAGRRDLFDGPVWQAVHNYARNRPLDYPYDIGNQEGAAYTDRFYRVLAGESWGEDAWRGRSLAEVNRLRHDRRSPGATIADDHACFLAYEYYDGLNRKHLGRSLPILSTECGYLVGEDVDPRYPATSPDLHMAQTLEACRAMMGTSQRFKHAPDYYFCTAFWLIANQELASTSTWWEAHAWYSERWPNGVLPIVRALQAEPKVTRVQQAPPERITLAGTIANAGESRLVELEREGALVARQALDAGSRFAFEDLDPGRYLVRLPGTALAQAVELMAGQGEVLINLEVAPVEDVISRSVVHGRVRGGAGASIMLVRTRDGEEWVTMARDDGAYRFVDLPPGEYKAVVYPTGTAVEGIKLDGRNTVEADLAATGWGYTIRVAEDTQRVGAIVVSTLGHKALRVQAHTADWSSSVALTGSSPENGQYAAVLAPLEADYYMITVDGAHDETGKPTQLEARVQVDKRSIPLVEFVYTEPVVAVAPSSASVRGRVVGRLGGGQPLQAVLIDEQGDRTTAFIDDEGIFVFPGLPAGRYGVTLAGLEEQVAAAEVSLDGRSAVDVELELPESRPAAIVDGRSVVAGMVAAAAGATARLIDAVGNERRTSVDKNGGFRFEQLPAGAYALFVDGGYQQPGLAVDGVSGVEVAFAPLITVWETSVTNAGSMPGFSSVRVEVEAAPNLPVRIWQGEEDPGQVAHTTASLTGASAVEFRPLGPGRYLVEPEGLGIWTEVELSGLEAMWVSFRRKNEPVGANTVRALAPSAPVPAALPERAAVTYLYLCAPPTRREDLLALLAYASRHAPQVGCDVEAAAGADRVYLLGVGEDLAEVEQQLLLRGVPSERVTGEWAPFFRKLGA